jgi:HEAT repeat protein
METLGTDEQRASVRGLLRDLKPFPAAKLVSLLKHPRLSVRLGALEVLEDAAGETFDFDPWLEVADAGTNAEALARWNAWATKGEVKAGDGNAPLNDETFRVLAQEITGGKPDRAERALRRLEGYGLAAIAPIERFLQSQTGLDGLPRAMLKQAQYRVVIAQSLPRQAPALARDLALGLPEAQSTALGGLAGGGVNVLPIIAEFLDSPDPLAREAAVDAAFSAAGKDAVPLIVERIGNEQAESVLHAMLRGLGKLAAAHEEEGDESDPAEEEPASASSQSLLSRIFSGSKAKQEAPAPAAPAAPKKLDAVEAVLKLLEHPSENVVVAAVEALGFQKGGQPTKALEKCLDDPRWRVRAAALETIGKRQLTDAAPAVKKRFEDPEIFVRVSAVQALARLSSSGDAFLLEQFEKQHELKPTILSVFLANSQKAPPDRVWELLQTAPPEIILQCLETFESRDDYQGKRTVHAARFAAHPNKDVAAAALRLLASHGRSTQFLVEALKSPDPALADAVLDALRLKPDFFGQLAAPASVATTANPVLDRLYADLRAAAPTASSASAGKPVPQGEANPSELAAVLRKYLREGSPQQKLRAALVLFPSGDAEARTHLLTVFETLAPVDRRAVAGGLRSLDDWTPVRELASRLLRDPADDVRETTIESWIESPARVGELLSEMAKPGSLVGPTEIYDWKFDRLLDQGGANAAILTWARPALADPQMRDTYKAFAIVTADRARIAGDLPIEPFTAHENPILRRAAYRALGRAFVETRLDAILRDPSALVRQVVPFLASPMNNTWQHFFDDSSFADDHRDYQDQRYRSRPAFGAWAGNTSASGPPSEAITTALEKLARDPAETVRFDAMFALLRLGKSVDPKAFATALASQPPERDARERLGDFFENEYARLGQGYGVLLPLVQGVRTDLYGKIRAHFKLSKVVAPTTFAALAKIAPTPAAAADNLVAPVIEPAAPTANAAGPFRVLFFHKVGCRECERARQMLAEQVVHFPQARIEERDIDDPQQALLNEALCARFGVKETLHQVTPAIFTQTGALVKADITFPAIGDLLRGAQAAPRDEAWDRVETPEIAAAETKIAERYDALSLGVVGMAGLLDGVNPCAFATIIFLLSYLQVARRSPREILAVGAAFIGAVFLAYFVVGLGLVQVIGRLDGMRVVGNVLNYLLAGFALILALFSFRDAQLASRGQMAEMTLQLPGALKEQIRTAIRTSAKARRFVIGAFLAGIVISLLELACTGQVYLPTILYMVRSGRGDAMAHLFAYNVAFILPLVIVFILAWAGMRSDALLKFQQKHVVLVKVMTGVLFLALTGFLLFGHKVLPMMAGR